MKTALAALIVGYGLDLLLGDPSFLYHPIRVIGNLIALLEKWLRKVFLPLLFPAQTLIPANTYPHIGKAGNGYPVLRDRLAQRSSPPPTEDYGPIRDISCKQPTSFKEVVSLYLKTVCLKLPLSPNGWEAY